jgi:hypothetical protein
MTQSVRQILAIFSSGSHRRATRVALTAKIAIFANKNGIFTTSVEHKVETYVNVKENA